MSKFLLLFGRLKFFLLFEEKQQKVIEKTGLTFREVVKLFEYGKNKEAYWDESKLHKQVVIKAYSIAETLYLGYLPLFLFDNAISHSVYVDNTLCITGINKKIGGKQVWLHNGWYEKDRIRIKQPMSYQGSNNSLV